MARTRTATQKLGLISAAAVLVVFAVVIAVFIVTGKDPNRAAIMPTDAPIADIMDTLGETGEPGARGLRIELADKSDPGRKAAEIFAERADPVGVQLYEVTQPRARIFMRDGQVVYVRAESGRFEGLDIKRNQAPSSGVLQGGVDVLLFPALGRPIDPETDTPSITMQVESMTFDFRVGKMTAPHTLSVVGPNWTYSGTNVTVLFSEVNERIELLTVERDNRLMFDPESASEAEPKAPSAPSEPAVRKPRDKQAKNDTTPTTPTTPSPGDEPADEPSIAYYHATLSDDVALWQEGRRIDADHLEMWARLVNGSIPDGTFAAARPAPALPATMPIELRVIAAAIAAQDQDNTKPGTPVPAGDFSAPVTLTWGGMLELEPVQDEPTPLANDNLFARFTVEASDRVRIAYDEIGDAYGDVFEIGATQRSIALLADTPDGVRVDAPGFGRLVAGMFRGIGRTGIAEIDGPGTIWFFGDDRIEPDPAERQDITWNRRADFQFDVRDEMMTESLRTAMFAGEVSGVIGDGAYTGDFLRAEFASTDTEASALRRLVGNGNVVADDGSGGRLECDDLDVAFDSTTAGEPDPTYLVAKGNVVGITADDELRCGRLEAELKRNDDGDIDVHDAFAEGGVVYTGKDSVTATCDSLRGNMTNQTVELLGEGSSVARGETTISGAAISLDGLTRSVAVSGAGDFKHKDDADTFAARWTTDMAFHDSTGELRCRGDVAAGVARPIGIDSIRADTLVANFEPADDADSDAIATGERRLLDVYASGASLTDHTGDPVQVRSVRFAEDNPSAIKRMVFLEGDELFGDETTGVLRVPGSGQLVLADHEGRGDERGNARFRWSREMLVERVDERITFRGGVELQHTRIGDGEQTDLLCEQLVAQLVSEGDEPSPTGRLSDVEAVGAVYLKSGTREVAADRIEYDADNGVAEITAAEGNLLTMFDSAAGTAMSARGITWNMITDRIKIDKPGRVIAPQSNN